MPCLILTLGILRGLMKNPEAQPGVMQSGADGKDGGDRDERPEEVIKNLQVVVQKCQPDRDELRERRELTEQGGMYGDFDVEQIAEDDPHQYEDVPGYDDHGQPGGDNLQHRKADKG